MGSRLAALLGFLLLAGFDCGGAGKEPSPPPGCGDGVCSSDEDPDNCPIDCGCAATPEALCGMPRAVAPFGCFCDVDCAHAGDCCSDVKESCGIPDDPEVTGAWGPVQQIPVYPVHAFLLPNGMVMLLQGTAGWGFPVGAAIWDPASGAVRTISAPSEDLFCSGHTFLEDGRLLIGGGHPIGAGNFSYIFDAATEEFRKVGNLTYPRWYPTLVRMADGRVFATGGHFVGANGAGQDLPEAAEIFDPATETWTVVAGSERNVSETYPGLHLLPSGDIFYTSGVGWAPSQGKPATFTFTGANEGTWSETRPMNLPDRQDGAGLLRVSAGGGAEVFVVGGGLPDDVQGDWNHHRPGEHALASVESIDATSMTSDPAWRHRADMSFERTNLNAIHLPDGSILAAGGARGFKYGSPSDLDPVLAAERYSPATDRWETLASMAIDRTYHSVLLLLPDGRVLIGGGEINPLQQQHFSLEVFTPPYLFRGPRPVIEELPNVFLGYGADFAVEVDRPGDIAAARLIAPGAITHHTDTGRSIDLAIGARGADRMTLRAPANANLAPPGWYLLFVVDGDGVPSVGRFVHVSGG